LRSQRRLDQQQCLAHRIDQRLAARREFHVAAYADQQGIIEIVAQAMQRRTHGGLRHEYLLGSAGNVLLAQQGVERDQQIQVEPVELHAPHCV
jgi:hypothetical protein